MPLDVPQLNIEALLVSLIRRIEALENAATPGDDTGFFSFGPSSKGNNMGLAGYDRANDETTAGGYVRVQTLGDTPNIVFIRQEVPWGDNTTVGRFGAIMYDENGDPFYNNGSDGEAGDIAFRVHIPSNGALPNQAHMDVLIQCINELENTSTKFPQTIMRITGENGGEIWGHRYNSAGALVASTQLF